MHLSGGKCDDDEIDVAYASNLSGDCTFFKKGMHYCCKTKENPLKNCEWVGTGDCADNTCDATEITLRTHNQGDTFLGCNCEFPWLPQTIISNACEHGMLTQ